MLSASEKDIAQAALAPGPYRVISADHHGVIREWNGIADRIFSHNANDAIGQSLDLVIPAEERPLCAKHEQRCSWTENAQRTAPERNRLWI
jgi:hypothetical protein